MIFLIRKKLHFLFSLEVPKNTMFTLKGGTGILDTPLPKLTLKCLKLSAHRNESKKTVSKLF